MGLMSGFLLAVNTFGVGCVALTVHCDVEHYRRLLVAGPTHTGRVKGISPVPEAEALMRAVYGLVAVAVTIGPLALFVGWLALPFMSAALVLAWTARVMATRRIRREQAWEAATPGAALRGSGLLSRLREQSAGPRAPNVP